MSDSPRCKLIVGATYIFILTDESHIVLEVPENDDINQ